MSKEGKSLGQVAFEAFYPEGDYKRTCGGGFAADEWVKDWERAAQAVKDAIPLHELADMDQAAFEDFRKKFKAEGAVEERERLAKLLSHGGGKVPFPDANGEQERIWIVQWMLDGGKP